MALIDVVQWNSTPDIFAWRFPETNLTTFTQLIVHQTQEAILFREGALLAKFGPGKHTLSTVNIPLLENLYGIPFGGKNPFTAEVWFVNKIFSLDIKWGTQQPFQIRDPEFGVMIPVRVYGQFGIRVNNPETFLVKLVGTLSTFDQSRLTDYFRGALMSRATSLIAGVISKDKVCVLDIAAHITQLSEAMRNALQSEFDNYGIDLVNFFINQISVPEEDSAVVDLKLALSKRAAMNIIGYDYQQERSFDVLGTAAKNTGVAGSMMGAGMGLGMGLGVGHAVGGMVQNISETIKPTTHNCPCCGTAIAQQARFCPSCGKPAAEEPAPAKITCSKCGHAINEGAKFCPNCGDVYTPCPKCKTDIAQDAAVCPVCGEKMPIKCPACASTVSSEARFCPACGKSIRPTCTGCGCEIGSEAAFCPKCGTKVEK